MRKAARGIVFRGNELLVIKRNKFGKLYYTLPGGGVDVGEVPEQTLRRELSEETGIEIGSAKLVFIERAGNPYGTQYIYLADYVSGDPKLSPNSEEAFIDQLGQNTHEPMWLTMAELAKTPFVSESLKRAILYSIKHGFPKEAQELSQNSFI